MEKSSNLARIAAQKAKKQFGTPQTNRKSEEVSYLKAKKAQEAYEATVMAANLEQDTYCQIQGRLKQECRDLEEQRLEYSLGKMQHFQVKIKIPSKTCEF